jgi:hypothetical protein
MTTSGLQRSWARSHWVIPLALRQRTTHNIDMAVELEGGVELALGRIQPALPVWCAKKRRQTITPDGTPELLGRRQTAIFLLQKF